MDNNRCRHCFIDFKDGKLFYTCMLSGKEISEDTFCNSKTCLNYKSRYIEYPITVNSIERDFGDDKPLGHEVGEFVAIKPCGEEYGGKTYFGILLGDLPMDITVAYNETDNKLRVAPLRNPAIYVPELKKIVYGAESWWRKIENKNDLKEITTEDINNTWYVRLFNSLSNSEN